MLEPLLLITHIAAGVTALVFAPVAMATRKGGNAHRFWGRVYFWAMFVIFVTALALLIFRPNVFLFIISVLSFYGAFSGTRSLSRKRPQAGQGATRLDWGGAWGALLAGVGFIAWGVLTLLGVWASAAPGAFSFLGVGFGSLLGYQALTDLRSFGRPAADKNWWWYYHMDRMLGSYIAAVTAFMVQSVGPRLPGGLEWTVWVAPALIGSPLIGVWIGYYKKKFSVVHGGRKKDSVKNSTENDAKSAPLTPPGAAASTTSTRGSR